MNRMEVEFLPDRRCVGRDDFKSHFLRGDTVLYNGEIYRVELVEFMDHWSNYWCRADRGSVVRLSGARAEVVAERELWMQQVIWSAPRGLWFWDDGPPARR